MKIKKLKIVPFETSHLRLIDMLPDELVNLEDIIPGGYGLGLSAFNGDKLIFCFGIARTAKNEGEAWSVCDKCVTQYLRELLYYCRKYLKKAFTELGFVKIYAHTRVDWKKSANFDRLLGFTKVGTITYPNGFEYYEWMRTQ